MASIPGVRFDITGASGSQGLLSPKSSWRVYVIPRGGFASAASTGALITFDSASVASRFAALDWIQAGLLTANIRQVAAVGGNSISVSGAVLTVAQNDRILIIGRTQPTVSGGSATYTVPATIIRQRDDDAATIYTNSMVTSNADGLIQFYSDPALYDAIIQDGNQSNQGYIANLAVGAVEGISTEFASVFGATVTFLAGVSMNRTLVVGQSVTLHGALGVTGGTVLGGSVTVTGRAFFGSTVTMDGTIGVTGLATLSGGATVASGLTVSTGIFGVSNQPMTILTGNITPTGQSIGTGVATLITWAIENYDVGGMHDIVANSNTIVIPVGAPGVYWISAQVGWNIGVTTMCSMSIIKGGDTTIAHISELLPAVGVSRSTQTLGTIDVSAAGATYVVSVIQNSGTTQSITAASNRATSQFMAAKLF
jgi:hypothetical protein